MVSFRIFDGSVGYLAADARISQSAPDARNTQKHLDSSLKKFRMVLFRWDISLVVERAEICRDAVQICDMNGSVGSLRR